MIEHITSLNCRKKSERINAAITLGKAFLDDPVLKYFLPEDTKDRALCIQNGMQWMVWALGQSFPNMASKITDGTDVRGVILWEPHSPNCAAVLRMPPMFIGCFLSKKAFGRSPNRKALINFYMGLEEKRKKHAGKPHWHLQTIAILPSMQGKGFGSMMLKADLAKADEIGMCCYLESSNPKNVPLYERHGFEVVEEVSCGEGGPVCHLMLRKPKRI